MIEMEDQTNDVHEAGIPVLDYKTYTDRVFFLPSKDGDKDVMITGKLDIPESRRPVVEQALYQFSNLLNSKCFLINVSGAGPLDHRAGPLDHRAGLPAAGRRGRRGGGRGPPSSRRAANHRPSHSSSTPWRTSGSSLLAPRSILRRC